MFNTDYGLINYGLSMLSIAGPNWFSNATASFAAIVIIDIWRYAPFTILILYPSITSISRELYDAAEIDGASYWQSFRRITLPLIAPAVATALTFRIIFGLRQFGPIYLFNGGGPVSATKVLSILLYEEGIVYWHFGLGSAIAVILLLVTMLFASPQIKAMQRAMFRS